MAHTITAHVTPTGDTVAHELADDCACGPTIEHVPRTDNMIARTVVHHSLDAREHHEHTMRARTIRTLRTKLGMPPAGRWSVHVVSSTT